MHTQLAIFLETLDLANLESSTIKLTPDIDLTISVKSRDVALFPATGFWQDFVGRNIVEGLKAVTRDKLDEMELSTCFVYDNRGYHIILTFNRAVAHIEPPTELPVELPLPRAENTTPVTPPGPRVVTNLPHARGDRFANTQPVRRDQFQGNNR